MNDQAQSLTGTLTAVESGRVISLKRIGHPALLVFHTKDSADAAQAIIETARSRHPDPHAALIASVVDLRGVPRLFRKVAERAMRDSYHQAAARLPDSEKPEDQVVILPDWKGEITSELPFTSVSKTPGVVVLDRAGKVVGHGQGPTAVGAAFELLARILHP